MSARIEGEHHYIEGHKVESPSWSGWAHGIYRKSDDTWQMDVRVQGNPGAREREARDIMATLDAAVSHALGEPTPPLGGSYESGDKLATIRHKGRRQVATLSEREAAIANAALYEATGTPAEAELAEPKPIEKDSLDSPDSPKEEG